LQLGLELGDLQHRQGLPLMHAVADVNVNVADEAGNLGMDIDHLIGLELPREGEHLVDVAGLHHGHLRRRRAGRGLDVAVRRCHTNQRHDHDHGDGNGGMTIHKRLRMSGNYLPVVGGPGLNENPPGNKNCRARGAEFWRHSDPAGGT